MIQKLVAKYRQLSRRERLVLSVTGGLAALLAMDRLVVSRAGSYLSEMDGKVELRKKEILKNERSVTLKPSLDSRYNEVVAGLRMAGTEEQNTAQILQEIEQLGSESGMAVSNLKPRASRNVESYQVLSVDLEGECTMGRFLTFLHKLQSGGHPFRVEGFKLRVHDKDPSLVRVTMSLTRLVLPEKPVSSQ